MKTKSLIIAALSPFVVISSSFLTGASPSESGFQSEVKTFLESYCVKCHGEKRQKADVTLHDISMDFDSAEVVRRWLDVLSQLENGEMPPEDAKQPSHQDRQRIIARIIGQLRLSGNPVEQLRSAPKYGNYVNHQELFSGEHKGPAFSRPRIWRISPYIDGPSSPFSLSQAEGFKDYAHMWSMDKPTIELLLVKARSVVEKQIGPSEAMLKSQDEIWKQQILSKRRNLEKELQALEVSIEENPKNEGLKKKQKTLTQQLERNKATDFEKDRKRPSGKLAGLQKMYSGVSHTATRCHQKWILLMRPHGS